MLWRLAESVPPARAISEASPLVGLTTSAAIAFHHGSPPSFGFRQFLAQDGECFPYLMVLEGVVDALFPALTPRVTNRSIIKVGISGDPRRRERELNADFLRGSAARWTVRNTRTFGNVREAYNAEGVLLQRLADSDCWISGEFAIVADNDLEAFLG